MCTNQSTKTSLIDVCVCIQMLDEVQYEQADVPTADTGFTMSTNTAYSTINTDKNFAYGANIGLNNVSVH